MLHPFGALIRPGKTLALIEALTVATGARRQELLASRQRVGVTRECVWIIPTVIGDFAVGFFESEDSDAIALFQYSDDDFDVWFSEQLVEALAAPADDVYTTFERVIAFQLAP